MPVLVPSPMGGMMNRFVKGDIGNPKGRRTLGASVTEWVNSLAERGTNEKQLKRIARNRSCNGTLRIAAQRMLRLMEDPDMADYEPLLDGQKCMKELRHDGVDTRVIKKVKSKTREIPQGDKPPIIETEREIELHDRSGSELDRLLDRTDGKPLPKLPGSDRTPLSVTIMKVEFDT